MNGISSWEKKAMWGIKPGDRIKMGERVLVCVERDGRPSVSENDFTSIDSKVTKMKTILATFSGVTIAIPYCEANINLVMNARIVEVEKSYYPATEDKITLTDKKANISIVNEEVIRPVGMSSEARRKTMQEQKAKLEAEISTLEKEMSAL